MRNSIEKIVRELGAIRIANLVGTDLPTNKIGSHPEDYDTGTGLFSCHGEHIQPIYEEDE